VPSDIQEIFNLLALMDIEIIIIIIKAELSPDFTRKGKEATGPGCITE
jgi:hypothetical protein